MATWHPTNAYQMQLSWLSTTGDAARLGRTLDILGDAIKATSRRIDDAQKTGDAEWLEIVVDEECAIIEDLIGTAFVVRQTYITGVVSRIVGLHTYHDKNGPNPLVTTSGNKHGPKGASPSILRFGSRKIGRSGRTAVELIDAFANYFKHHEEWTGSWSNLKGGSTSTARAVMSVGARRGSTGNLRTGAERLGNKEYWDFEAFQKCLTRWTNNLLAGYAQEMHKRGLITAAGLKSVRRRRV